MTSPTRKSEETRPQMSFGWHGIDPLTLPSLARDFLESLVVGDRASAVFLISCGQQKQQATVRAEELYTSSRFNLSSGLPKRLKRKFSILSAKHGLLDPGKRIQPYDVSLRTLSRHEQMEWAKVVDLSLKDAYPTARHFILLTDEDYSHDIVPLLQKRGVRFTMPLNGMDRGCQELFLKNCHRFLDRQNAVTDLYEAFSEFNGGKELPTLKSALDTKLPSQGVYYFFDANEPTRYSANLPRLVRIGTHAISAGSKATLRDRLRAHFGTNDGYGNHRSSVFRLHVGEAIIRRDSLRSRYPKWGSGQSADRSVSESERGLERMVSSYVSNLRLLCVDVSDTANKASARSKIERNSIALFTENLISLEPPSSEWLGLHSAHDVISSLGLWNIKETGGVADLSIVKVIKNCIEKNLPQRYG